MPKDSFGELPRKSGLDRNRDRIQEVYDEQDLDVGEYFQTILDLREAAQRLEDDFKDWFEGQRLLKKVESQEAALDHYRALSRLEKADPAEVMEELQGNGT